MSERDQQPWFKEMQAILRFKRDGNTFVKVESLRERMRQYGVKPEDLGTTEEELKTFFVADCRVQIESDLENWRLTDSLGDGESVFAKGVCEALTLGGLKHDDFGITDLELAKIKRCAGS